MCLSSLILRLLRTSRRRPLRTPWWLLTSLRSASSIVIIVGRLTSLWTSWQLLTSLRRIAIGGISLLTPWRLLALRMSRRLLTLRTPRRLPLRHIAGRNGLRMPWLLASLWTPHWLWFVIFVLQILQVFNIIILVIVVVVAFVSLVRSILPLNLDQQQSHYCYQYHNNHYEHNHRNESHRPYASIRRRNALCCIDIPLIDMILRIE